MHFLTTACFYSMGRARLTPITSGRGWDANQDSQAGSGPPGLHILRRHTPLPRAKRPGTGGAGSSRFLDNTVTGAQLLVPLRNCCGRSQHPLHKLATILRHQYVYPQGSEGPKKSWLVQGWVPSWVGKLMTWRPAVSLWIPGKTPKSTRKSEKNMGKSADPCRKSACGSNSVAVHNLPQIPQIPTKDITIGARICPQSTAQDCILRGGIGPTVHRTGLYS